MDQGNRLSEIGRVTLVSDDVSDPAPKTYQERIDLRLCTRCGKHPAKADSNLGVCCHEKVKALQAKSARARRAGWRRKNRCTRCGRRRHPRSDWGCSKCLAELGRLRKVAVDQHVDRTRDHLERDGYARTRYHGQTKRGAPSTASLDSMDLRDALKGMVAACQAFEDSQTEQVKQLPPIQRDDHTDAWISIVSRVERVINGIKDRHPDTMKRIGVDENRRRGAEIARTRRKTRG